MLCCGYIKRISDSDCTSIVSNQRTKAVCFRRSDGAERDVSIVFSSATLESGTTAGKIYGRS